ncbi:MAG: AAA family ATPase [Solibacillus sp.]
MLVNFRFGNYLSYNNLAEFSMVNGNTRRHPKHVMKFKDVSLLKFAAVYGANASGKSNLVKAIGFSKKLVVNGFKNTVTSDKYCKIYPQNKDELTHFEYEILIEGIVYSYGFSVNLYEKVVYREWLYSLANNKEEELFVVELEDGNYKYEINYDSLGIYGNEKTRLQFYLEDFNVLSNSLFITELNINKKPFLSNNNESLFNLLYSWFREKLEVIAPDESPTESGITYLRKDNGIALSNFLDSFGTGVKEIGTKEIHEKDLYTELPSKVVKKILEEIRGNDSESKHALLKTPNNIYEIENEENGMTIKIVYFKHSSEEVLYSLGEESDGTVRLVEIYDILASDSEKVFVVDEIDRSLHPNLTHNFIKTYLQKENKGQLIVTTHEDRLLDLDMLRRDEIWFVEKQEDGESNLYSLEKFKERFDKDILKAYLDGRYGSIPKFKIFSELHSRG